MATTASSLFSLRTTTPKLHRTTTLFSCPNFVQPKFTLKFPRLGVSYAKEKGSKKVSPFVISCLVDDSLNAEGSYGDAESNPGATIDLKLPRRSLLVQFTCNACGVRSQKLINRLAYEKGMVFVQCTGCEQYHKLVDNLNLVVEYDFREEINASPDADQLNKKVVFNTKKVASHVKATDVGKASLPNTVKADYPAVDHLPS